MQRTSGTTRVGSIHVSIKEMIIHVARYIVTLRAPVIFARSVFQARLLLPLLFCMLYSKFPDITQTTLSHCSLRVVFVHSVQESRSSVIREHPLSKMEPSPEPPRPHHQTYEHDKNVKKGAERLPRRSGTGVSGQPKKSGHGGKFTWDGPTSEEDYSEDVVIALDEKDPNYVDEPKEDEVRADVLHDSKEPAVVQPKVTKEALAT